MMKTKIKICGVTRKEDALFALQAGADFIGMIFYEKSSRYIPKQKAREITNFLKEKGFNPPPAIGVFVNEKSAIVNQIAREAGLYRVQLHGEESPEYCGEIEIPYIKAFRVRSAESLSDVENYHPWAFLFDAWHPEKYGGTGKRIDPAMLASGLTRHRMFLAGGLNPENVTEALGIIQPFCVDVSSGVEISPGVKDHGKIESFIRRVKKAG